MPNRVEAEGKSTPEPMTTREVHIFHMPTDDMRQLKRQGVACRRNRCVRLVESDQAV